jgi:hypothetical protein
MGAVFASNLQSIDNRKIKPKSLFRNILRVSYLESRFCPGIAGYASINGNRINILAGHVEKIWGTTRPTRFGRESIAFQEETR